jgi:hypothetical protein
MQQSSGSAIVNAVHYIHEVCEEVAAVAKVLQERFREQPLPGDYVSDQFNSWPTQFPATNFFEAGGCWINIYVKRPRRGYHGCAAYLFDLGGRNTFATLQNEALILVGWTGKNSDDDVYDVEHLESVLSRNVPFGSRLLCWIEENQKPATAPADQAWCYAVPLLSIKSEDDVERLLIKPLITMAVAPQLTEALVERAFENATEVMKNKITAQ